MRTFIFLFFISTLVSCERIENKQTDNLNSNLFFGEWRADSSSSYHWFGDRLIIQPDSSIFWFSGSDGGSLYSRGQWTGEDTLELNFEQKMKISLLDSNRIHVSGAWNNLNLGFVRVDPGNVHEYLQQDSIRSRIVGWWKMLPRQTPVKLINYRGFFDKPTLNFDDAGNATFYLDNKFDSTVTYSYRMYKDGVSLQYGCIVSDSKVYVDNDRKMNLLLNSRDVDTLRFERLTDIK